MLNCVSSNTTPQNLSQAKPFTVLKSMSEIDQIKNTSFSVNAESQRKLNTAGRKRDTITIVSQEAYKWSFEERSQTAMKAAIEIQSQVGFDAVIVELHTSLPFPSNGRTQPVARAEYAPDSKGFSGSSDKVWEVKASKYQATEDKIKILSYWREHRDQFDNGKSLDEDALKLFIVKKYLIKSDAKDIHLPIFSFSDYADIKL